MSHLGQTRKSSWPTPTSALPLKADIRRVGWHVRKVPNPDMASGSLTKRKAARRRLSKLFLIFGSGRTQCWL
jgi:hypothetical protein